LVPWWFRTIVLRAFVSSWFKRFYFLSSYRRGATWARGAVACATSLGLLLCGPAEAAASAAPLMLRYDASWAGLPAAKIYVRLEDWGAAYATRIEVQTEGIPRWFSRFKARADSTGSWSADGAARPTRYDAVYDLRKRKDKRVSLRFREEAGALIAERGPEDTSKRPPPDETYRRNVVDPLTALAAVRHQLLTGALAHRGSFVIPVFDSSRRFNVEGRVEPEAWGDKTRLLFHLMLRPITGFKEQTKADPDEDIEDKPRAVEMTFTDDERFVPLRLSVWIVWLPAIVALDRECAEEQSCAVVGR
jgi:Protein of unknown function (DUF3108)